MSPVFQKFFKTLSTLVAIHRFGEHDLDHRSSFVADSDGDDFVKAEFKLLRDSSKRLLE